MKTKILSIALLFAVIAGFSKSTYAATINADYTLLKEIKAVNKVEVRGNVELFISDSPVEQVKVYNKYYSQSALVQSQNGVLRIASYSTDKLVVWVTANDLRAISAFDNSEVKSFGDISKIEFDVDLHNQASAKLNIDAFSTSLTVNDDAKATLSGNVTEYALNCDREENVDHKNLVAGHTSKKQIQVKSLDLADL